MKAYEFAILLSSPAGIELLMFRVVPASAVSGFRPQESAVGRIHME